MTTNITAEDLRKMSDAHLIVHLRKFPFRSQYLNPDAYDHAEYRLALMQGRRYAQTGNINSFKKIV